MSFSLRTEIEPVDLKILSLALSEASTHKVDLSLYKAYVFEREDEYVVIFWDAKKSREEIGKFSPDVPGFEVVFSRDTFELKFASYSR